LGKKEFHAEDWGFHGGYPLKMLIEPKKRDLPSKRNIYSETNDNPPVGVFSSFQLEGPEGHHGLFKSDSAVESIQIFSS